MVSVETFVSICIGIGLSAACGFRVFVPLLCLSIGSLSGHVHLADSFAWIGTTPALIAFGVATVLEIGAYYIPFVDNLLDTIAVPAAAIAGILVTASVMVDVDPFWRWTLAVIAGGGIATTTQLGTSKLRAASSVTTAGLGNPVLATVEAGLASLLSVLSLVWPVLALIVVLVLLAGSGLLIHFVGKRVLRLFGRKPPGSPVSAEQVKSGL